MEFYPLHKHEISFLFIKLNVSVKLPSVLCISCTAWRWPRWPKHVAVNDKYW